MSARQGFSVRKRKSRSIRAGLLFPVGRIHRLCRKGPWVGSRISAGAPVYLAAVMEYLAAELLEQAGLVARYGSSGRISPRHIKMAVKRDEELDRLCEGVVIVGGGDELEKEIPAELLRADMAGDLRGPTHFSMMDGGYSSSQKKKKSRKPKKWHSCVGNKVKDQVVDLTGERSENIIDLTEDNEKESKRRKSETRRKDDDRKKDKVNNGKTLMQVSTVDLTKDDDESIGKFKELIKWVKSPGEKYQKREHVAKAKVNIGKTGHDKKKTPSFEEEMKRADLLGIYKQKKKGSGSSSYNHTKSSVDKVSHVKPCPWIQLE